MSGRLTVLSDVPVDEIDLTFSGDFCCERDADGTVRIVDGTLFQLEQAHFQSPLCRAIPAFSELDQESIIAEALEKSVLADVHAVLFEQGRKLAHKDGRLRC